jgi:hypothetical protein
LALELLICSATSGMTSSTASVPITVICSLRASKISSMSLLGGSASVTSLSRRAARGPLVQAAMVLRRVALSAQNVHRSDGARAALARHTHRLRGALVEAVIGSAPIAAEGAVAFGVSWWLVQQALNTAILNLPVVDDLSPTIWALMSTDTGQYGPSRTRRRRHGGGMSRG